MKLFACVLWILVLIHPAPSHTVSSSLSSSLSSSSSFYQYYPGLVWDHCTEPLAASRHKCLMMCQASKACLGTNFRDDGKDIKPCQLCLSSDTRSVSNVSSSSSQSMYFRFNTQIYQPAGSPVYYVNLPNGLVDGQVIFLRARIDFSVDGMYVIFLDDPRWPEEPLPEADFIIHMTFVSPYRPNAISVNSFNSTIQNWSQAHFQKPADEFLVDGEEASVVVFVNQLTYTVYIDGRLFYDYPRSQRRDLKDFKYIRLDGDWPYIQMTIL